jgi:hypothetical protein
MFVLRGHRVDVGDFSSATMVLQYPGTAKRGKVSLERLVSLPARAEYGRLRYYATTVEVGKPHVRLANTGGGSGGLDKVFRVGNSFYALAISTVGEQRLDLGPGLQSGVVSAMLEVIGVPSELVEALYPRAAGRERNEALMRDLMRHAQVAVSKCDLIPPRMKGRAAAKLAAIAMTHNAEAEIESLGRLALGCAELNKSLTQAFSNPTGFFGFVMRTRITVRSWIRWITACWREKGSGWVVVAFLTLLSGLFIKLWKFTRFMKLNHIRAYLLSIYHYLRKSSKPACVAACTLRTNLRKWLRVKHKRLVPGDALSAAGNGTDTVRNVLIEESLKRVHVSVTPTLIAYEFAKSGGDLYYLPTALMHIVSARQDFFGGFLVHCAWNFGVRRGWCQPFLKKESTIAAPQTVCVDEFRLRDNEPVAAGALCEVPNSGPDVRLACIDPTPSWHFCAVAIEGVEVAIFRSCACNERAAVRSRVTCQINKENVNWEKWWPKVRKVPEVVEPDVELWLKHLPTRARGQLESAPTLMAPDRRAKLMKAFIKRELGVVAVRGVATKSDPVPRIIQGRSVEVKLATGPFTWAYGKMLKEVYSPYIDGNNILYAGGRSGEEVGEFYERISTNLGAVGEWMAFDCKRFDRTVGPTPMRKLWEEYEECGASDLTLRALAGRDQTRRGYTSHGIKFHRQAQVSSGDGDTTAGNSRIHMVLLEACPYVEAAIVMGDDSLVYALDPDSVLAAYRAGGFEPKLSKDIDFCSALFWPTDSGLVLGPKIGRVLGKTFHSMEKRHDYMPWLRGVCLSLRLKVSFVPILRVLVERLLILAGDGKVYRAGDHNYKFTCDGSHNVCDATWGFMQDRYGLGEHEVKAMEAELATFEIGDRLIGDRWVNLVERDA